MENHDYEDWPVADNVHRTAQCSYIYSPPAWMVCDKCGGVGELDTRMYLMLKSIPAKQKCTKCHGAGRIEIRYTPEQWRAAGGVLTDDTPVWVLMPFGSSPPHWMMSTIDGAKTWENIRIAVVIATEAGRPPEDWRGE